jgi:hypothetical protein
VTNPAVYRTLKTNLYKACPRCHGHLLLDPEAGDDELSEAGPEYTCIQCGRHTTLKALLAARQEAVSATPAW